MSKQDTLQLIQYAMNCAERGLTCDEWEANSGKPHQTASARVNELAAAGVIILTSDKRSTRRNRKAGVYRIDPAIGSEKEAYQRFLKWQALPRTKSRCA